MEFRDTANVLENIRVDSASKKHGHGGVTYHQDYHEGSPLHEGDEEDESCHQVTHGNPQNMPSCRICKWLDANGRKWLNKP